MLVRGKKNLGATGERDCRIGRNSRLHRQAIGFNSGDDVIDVSVFDYDGGPVRLIAILATDVQLNPRGR